MGCMTVPTRSDEPGLPNLVGCVVSFPGMSASRISTRRDPYTSLVLLETVHLFTTELSETLVGCCPAMIVSSSY